MVSCDLYSLRLSFLLMSWILLPRLTCVALQEASDALILSLNHVCLFWFALGFLKLKTVCFLQWFRLLDFFSKGVLNCLFSPNVPNRNTHQTLTRARSRHSQRRSLPPRLSRETARGPKVRNTTHASLKAAHSSGHTSKHAHDTCNASDYFRNWV